MNFDCLAPHYDWMEAVMAGGLLQRARMNWLESLVDCRRILSVGEGHGKFAAAFGRRFPEAELTCVEASQRIAGARPASDRSFGRVGAVDASRGSDLVAPGTTVRCHRHLLLPRLLSTGSAAHSRRSAGSRCDRQGRVAARRFRDTRSWRRPVARASDPRRDVRLLPRGHAIAGQPPLSAGRTVARTRVSSRRPPGVLVWSAAGRSLAALSPYGANNQLTGRTQASEAV